MKIRSGCEGGGKGPLVQNDLSATLATHQDQTVFAPKAYANGDEETARTLTARADGSPMLDRGPNLIVQKGNSNEKDYCD